MMFFSNSDVKSDLQKFLQTTKASNSRLMLTRNEDGTRASASYANAFP